MNENASESKSPSASFSAGSTSDVLLAETRAITERVQARLNQASDSADSAEASTGEDSPWGGVVRHLREAASKHTGDDALAPLYQLAIRFGLSTVDQDILACAIAPHLDPDVPELYRKLRGAMWSEHVDAALLMRLFADQWDQGLAVRRAIGPQSALISNGLLRVRDLPGGATALQAVVGVHPRILHFIVGEEGLHHVIAPYCEVERPQETLEQVVLPDAIIARVLELTEPHAKLSPSLERWGYDKVLGYGRGTNLLFVGAPGTGKTLLARTLANHLGTPLLRVHLSKTIQGAAAIEDVFGELQIEAQLRRALVFFDDCAPLFAQGGATLAALLAFLERFEGLTILATNQSEHLNLALERRVLLRVDFPRPDALARERIFEALLPPEVPVETGTDIQHLAGHYDFTGGNIKNAVMVALNKALSASTPTPLITQSLLVEACEHQLRYRLDDLAVLAEAKLTMEDVILSPAVKAQVTSLLAACRHHTDVMSTWGFGSRLVTGRGIVALFEGVPGTGKTLCAEVLGQELGLQVSRVDIPSIVSKWIGETEQHLSDLFRRAKAGRSILLFDEADALFGKRVENTERATDRYANMEINTLLQEIERYDGIVILTTNLATAMDDAVKRRILFRIKFEEPTAEMRSRIWQTLLPGKAPVADDVDFEELGDRFDFPGGRIKNAVLRAAYRAQEMGSRVIAMDHFLTAGVAEARAAGQAVREWDNDAERERRARMS